MKTLENILKDLEKLSGIELFVIDLFCGAGGLSEGVEQAKVNGDKCAKVVVCINHDKNAILSHNANMPDALHFIEDIRTIELLPITKIVDRIRELFPESKIMLHASLECTNFSKAKGGQPRDADSRTLAEHLFRYIDVISPEYIQIENVEEFMSWGDMDENGKPISRDKGRLYQRWVNNVKKYGYDFDYRILNAADYGSYTSRKRYFGLFAKGGLPIVFPEPTHCKNGKQDMFTSLKKWKPVKHILDLEDEGTSIFNRKRALSPKTLERIYAGLVKFVAGGKDAFLSRYNSVAAERTALSLESPCGVVTTNNRFAKVQCHFLSKYFSGHPESKNIPITGPAHTIKCKDNHALVTTDFLSAYYGNGHNHSINSPSPTLTTKDRLAYIKPQFLDMQYGTGKPVSINGPACTVTSTPKHNLVTVDPWVMNTNFGNVGSSIEEPSPVITANRKWHYLMNPQFASAGGDINKPCFTLIARMDKMPPYLIATESGEVIIQILSPECEQLRNIKQFMAMYGIVDIKMRMLRIPELKRIMGFPEDYVLIGTQAEQKKFIGNAVEVTQARKNTEALCRKLRELRKNAA